MHTTSTVIIAVAGLAVLGTSEAVPGSDVVTPRSSTTTVQPAASEDGEPVTEAGPKAAESVTISMRPIPYPPAAAAPPAGPVDLERTGVLVDAYRAAADAAPLSCHLPVALLAAIGQIESGSAGGRQIGADHRVNPPIYGPVLDGGPFAAIRDTDGGLFDGDTSGTALWDRCSSSLARGGQPVSTVTVTAWRTRRTSTTRPTPPPGTSAGRVVTCPRSATCERPSGPTTTPRSTSLRSSGGCSTSPTTAWGRWARSASSSPPAVAPASSDRPTRRQPRARGLPPAP